MLPDVVFGALREEGVSVILISQGSSEHSICCAVPRDQAEARDERIAVPTTIRDDFAEIVGTLDEPDRAFAANRDAPATAWR